MCITIPAKVIEVINGEVCILKVEMAGVIRPVVCMIDNPQIGEHVLVNSGTAVQKLSSEQVAEISSMWETIVNELEGLEMQGGEEPSGLQAQ